MVSLSLCHQAFAMSTDKVAALLMIAEISQVSICPGPLAKVWH
jgi:hypothetical protein